MVYTYPISATFNAVGFVSNVVHSNAQLTCVIAQTPTGLLSFPQPLWFNKHSARSLKREPRLFELGGSTMSPVLQGHTINYGMVLLLPLIPDPLDWVNSILSSLKLRQPASDWSFLSRITGPTMEVWIYMCRRSSGVGKPIAPFIRIRKFRMLTRTMWTLLSAAIRTSRQSWRGSSLMNPGATHAEVLYPFHRFIENHDTFTSCNPHQLG